MNAFGRKLFDMHSAYEDLGFGADFSKNNKLTREKTLTAQRSKRLDDFTREVAIILTIFNTVTNKYAYVILLCEN